jgi:hypothetical protein
MKHWKSVALGFVAGAVAMSATPVLGAVYQTVSAVLMHDATFQIGEEAKASPSDQPVLNYNNYTYVPTRFVAEALGCEVKWNAASRKVIITPPKEAVKIEYVEKEVEKIVYVDKDSEEGAKVYSAVPVRYYGDGYTVILTSVSMNKDVVGNKPRTRTYITLENDRVDKVELVPDDAKLTLDGKDYYQPKSESLWDDKWRNEYAKKDKELKGYLIFDDNNTEYSTGTLEFKVRVYDDNQLKTDTITLDFKK